MSTPIDGEEKKFETIGRTIGKISFWLFALKFIAVVSIISLVILYFINKPLWLAPIIGIILFSIYRFLRRFVFSKLIQYSREASEKDNQER